MTRVRFEHTTPVFQRVKTFHSLDRITTVTGKLHQLNSVAFSPQANYTDRADAACR
jgi:hypothetical protein